MPECSDVDLSHAEACIGLAEGYGLVLDDWQENVVRVWFRLNGQGRWCAKTWGLSVARQNGKNGALEAIELYLMVGLGHKILHTSHLLSSARKAFKRLKAFFGNKQNDPHARFPELNALVKEVRNANGQEAIELHNGGLIEVAARTGGAGRGTTFDFLIVDEAQQYEEDEQEALEPATSAAMSGDPVTVYMGTPPKVVGERGEPFMRVRSKALTGMSSRTAWVEHSPQGDLDKMTEIELQAFVRDRKNWAAANPAMGIRINVETIEGELERMSPRSFARERLNMFPLPAAELEQAFPEKVLKSASVDEYPLDGDLAVSAWGLDMNPDKNKITICAAVRGEYITHLELAIHHDFAVQGVSAVVEWFWQRCKKRIPVVLDVYSPARDLLEAPLKKRGIKVFVLGQEEYMQACSQLHHAFHVAKNVTWYAEQNHFYESLRRTLKSPVKNRPGSFKWVRDDLDVELMPTMAATCALFGSIKFARVRRSSSTSTTKRHAVVL